MEKMDNSICIKVEKEDLINTMEQDVTACDERKQSLHLEQIKIGKFKCEHCGQKFELNALKAHLRIHTEVEPLKCEHCGKSFEHQNDFQMHVKTHDGDNVNELAGDVMKAQLKDTSDIVTTLELAPATRKLMIWKETGGAEKLFGAPGRVHATETLLRSYTKNLNIGERRPDCA